MAVPSEKKAAGHRVVNGVQVPIKALPVTLLSGFLGSGKTTLLQHILQSDHGLRIAVLVNDIGAINVDANLIEKTHRVTQTKEKVVALQNGCICCTLRGDLLEELVNLAELYTFDYVVIESSGISEPEQVAETFDSALSEQMKAVIEQSEDLDENTIKVLDKVANAGGIENFARLDTTVTVIDAFTMLNDFDTEELLSNRRDDVDPVDERTVSHLMVDQIEFADVIILNKTDRVDPETLDRLRERMQLLNHRAKLLETSYAKVDVKEIVNTGLFDLEKARTGYGWLQDLHEMSVREVNGKKTVTPKPETEEYNIRNFIYTNCRPFHPRRLYGLLHDKFILQLEHPEQVIEVELEYPDDEEEDKKNGEGDMDVDSEEEDDDEEDEEDEEKKFDNIEPPSNEVILANKRADALISRLFRSKGEFFLATRPNQAGEWSQAGAMLSLLYSRPWFCTLPEEAYTTGDEDIDRMVKHDMAKGGEWGDRRQEIVFIGEKLDTKALTKLLDECLLNDEEYAQWEKIMRRKKWSDEKKEQKLADIFEDGFPDWPTEEDEEDHEGHNHGPGGHGH